MGGVGWGRGWGRGWVDWAACLEIIVLYYTVL